MRRNVVLGTACAVDSRQGQQAGCPPSRPMPLQVMWLLPRFQAARKQAQAEAQGLPSDADAVLVSLAEGALLLKGSCSRLAAVHSSCRMQGCTAPLRHSAATF